MSATSFTGIRAAAAVAVVLAVAGCRPVERVAGPPGAAGTGLKLVGALQSFAACDELLGYLRREGARMVGPYGLAGPMVAFGRGVAVVGDLAATAGAERAAGAPAPSPVAGEDYSATNVQEAGVDEPDLVKTDGRLLVALAQGGLRIVDVAGEAPRLLSTLPVTGQHRAGELLLAGDRVLVLHPAEPGVTDLPQPSPAPGAGREGDVAHGPLPADRPQARVTVVDIAQPASPEVVAELTLDGSLVSARMVDGVARLVLRSGAPAIPFVHPSGPSGAEAATDANRRRLAESSLDDWMPGYTYSASGAEATAGRLGDCRDVARPREFSGLGMVSVLTVDPEDPRPGPAATVVGAGELVYASADNLYVTTTRWTEPEPGDGGGELRLAPATTEIHKFDVGDKVRTRYEASGSVPGRLLNQFSMSEHEGDLRVATTTDGVSRGLAERGASESQVVVLRQDGAALGPVGSVGGLGKGEQIYAVRFLGDRGYVVTFRQTDPLYVVDLADPEAPVVRGELKIPGYSAYLHPVGEHRLLGVGQEATEQGRPVGTQLSLFDVSDPASPRRLAHRVLAQGRSEAELDHHAFLYWPRTGLTVLPLQSHGRSGVPGGDTFQGAAGFAVGEEAIREVGRVRQRDGSPIRRSLVVSDRVLTLSDGGLLGSAIETLDERSWLPF